MSVNGRSNTEADHCFQLRALPPFSNFLPKSSAKLKWYLINTDLCNSHCHILYQRASNFVHLLFGAD